MGLWYLAPYIGVGEGMANEEPALEEYWEALRGPQMTPERAGMVSQEEIDRARIDRAIIARSDHLRASIYYRQPEQEEEPSEEEIRQAILNRAPYMAEWVTADD
jgi:hypothetical protein